MKIHPKLICCLLLLVFVSGCKKTSSTQETSTAKPAASANAACGPAVWLSAPAAATPIDAPVALALSSQANASVFVPGAAAREASA